MCIKKYFFGEVNHLNGSQLPQLVFKKPLVKKEEIKGLVGKYGQDVAS